MMRYDIQNRSDFSSGAMLVVSIPEDDLDQKAFYTLQADQPDFLVPFRYRNVDGQMEFTYQLGSRTKLQYRFGLRMATEYVDFWTAVLHPFLECTDWFLKPDSFVLDINYLYLNSDGKMVSYLYVPSKKGICGADTLKSMVTELSQKNPVSDVDLENKVLRAVMQDFQPKAFLRMLRETNIAPGPVQTPTAAPPISRPIPAPPVSQPTPAPHPTGPAPAYQLPASVPAAEHVPDGIFISIPQKGEVRPKKEKKGLFGRKREADSKPSKKGGFFRSKEKPEEIVLGAVAASDLQQRNLGQAQVFVPQPKESGLTEVEDGLDGACFRLVSTAPLPGNIPVTIEIGGVFTIGRFDVSVGRKQSDFEFEKGTKAVSRHHAAIERGMDGAYSILDLSSSAGTFVNGERLPPNVPFRLERGYRVSFGTGGADYVWEE